MFKRGDILKVKNEWLSEAEKADPKYAECLYVVKECFDNKVTVVSQANNFLGYSIHTWPADTMYLVGHVDAKEVK